MHTNCAAPCAAVFNGHRFPKFAGRGFHQPSRPRAIVDRFRAAGQSGDGWEAALSEIKPYPELRYGLAGELYSAWREGSREVLAAHAERAILRNADIVNRGGGAMSFHAADDLARRLPHASAAAIAAELVPLIRQIGIRGWQDTDERIGFIVRATVREHQKYLRERAAA